MSKIGGFLPLLATLIPLLAGGLTAAAAGTSVARNIKNMVQGRGIISDLGIPIISPLAAKIGLGRKRRGKGIISDLGIPILSPLAAKIGLGRKRKGKGGPTIGPPLGYGIGGAYHRSTRY